MTDKKMTKAEMAAQMGITPEQLAEREAANKARIAAANAPAASLLKHHLLKLQPKNRALWIV